MEWIANGRTGSEGVKPEDVKVCELCGTLNYHKNTECFTCAWQGQFSCDAATIYFAWQRLVDRYEAVQMEHLVAHSHAEIGEFGERKRAGYWHRFRSLARRFWRGLSGKTPQRTAARIKVHLHEHSSPRKDIGV